VSQENCLKDARFHKNMPHLPEYSKYYGVIRKFNRARQVMNSDKRIVKGKIWFKAVMLEMRNGFFKEDIVAAINIIIDDKLVSVCLF